MRHVLRSQQFDRELLTNQLFPAADRIRSAFDSPAERSALRTSLQGRILLNQFFEASTRTRFSFEFAAINLGMTVLNTENAKVFSSFVKGESLEDGIRILCSYRPDVIVIRHDETGAVERAAGASNVPIVNAGDGKGQHPTQALLDLYTMQRELGTIDGLHVVIGGDLANGRTVRSLACSLSKFKDVHITFVAPSLLRVGEDIKEHLREQGVSFEETEDLKTALSQADVVYWTRIQKERITDPTLYEKVKDAYSIGKEEMSWMKPKSILMHPLPRVGEIKEECDEDPRAAYFRQAENGLFIRMAVLQWLFDAIPA